MRKDYLFNYLFGGVFAFIGLVFLIVGIFAYKDYANALLKGKEVTAEITDIEHRSHGDKDYHDVYLTYTYDGITYSDVEISFYSSTMYIGEKIAVYVDPLNPSDVMAVKGENLVGIIFLIIGIVYIPIGAPFLIYPFVKEHNIRKLLENGRCVYGVITEIVCNGSITMNGRHPYFVICNYFDPASGKTYKFKSQNSYKSLNDYFNVGDSIAIYINPDNYKKYFVDIRTATENDSRIVDYT